MQAQLSGDSRIYEANSNQELIAKIRDQHPYPEISVEAFMRAYANRIKLWNGSKVSTTSVADFLADLQQCGHIKIWT